MNIADIKNRFGIIGHDPQLESVINTAVQIASTDLTVLVRGESGVGKENIPKIIHFMGARKHKNYVAINCGAIPEGTIDSELFGHEKGSFTGATEARKGYFEEANGGTIFLDEVGELPLSTQVRLLRVLETGEFIRVGSSKVQKTDVRVIAASNIDFEKAIAQGKFREDLYYRLNIVPIHVPPLRERKGDIFLLFKKFAFDISEKYQMPTLTLEPSAKALLENYRWPGNIRQLRNITEQISILESNRLVSVDTLKKYIPIEREGSLPMVVGGANVGGDGQPANNVLFQMLITLNSQMLDMRKEIDELKAVIASGDITPSEAKLEAPKSISVNIGKEFDDNITDAYSEEVVQNEQSEQRTLSISDTSTQLIIKALEKHHNNRKAAALELGISERTLYRRLKSLEEDKR